MFIIKWNLAYKVHHWAEHAISYIFIIIRNKTVVRKEGPSFAAPQVNRAKQSAVTRQRVDSYAATFLEQYK